MTPSSRRMALSLRMESFLSVSILPMQLSLWDWDANERSLLERFTLRCAILPGLWLWGENHIYLPSRSGWRTLCRMYRCGKHWRGGHGSLRPAEIPPEKFLVSFESEDGSGVLKMDQPLSSFAERRFGARFVHSEWMPFPQGVTHASA